MYKKSYTTHETYEIDLPESYLHRIINSVDSATWRHAIFFKETKSVPTDEKGEVITKKHMLDLCVSGGSSGALFVSSVIQSFNDLVVAFPIKHNLKDSGNYLILDSKKSRIFLKSSHVGIEGLLRDMLECGWEEHKDKDIPDFLANPMDKKYSAPINIPPGAIILWGRRASKPKGNTRHVGFFTGGISCVSNNPRKGAPDAHDITFRHDRSITAYFTHPVLTG